MLSAETVVVLTTTKVPVTPERDPWVAVSVVFVCAAYSVTAAVPAPFVKVTNDPVVQPAPPAGYAGALPLGLEPGPLKTTH